LERARGVVESEVPVMTPEQDRAILQQAGFTAVTDFSSTFSFSHRLQRLSTSAVLKVESSWLRALGES
jgi:hypothetical protein